MVCLLVEELGIVFEEAYKLHQHVHFLGEVGAILVEVVEDFEGGLGLGYAEVFVFFDEALDLDQLFHFVDHGLVLVSLFSAFVGLDAVVAGI